MLLDQFDLHTLDERQHDGRRSKQALAERVGLSPLPCLLITGQSADDQLKVIVPNRHAYWSTLLNKINKIEGVAQVPSSLVLRQVSSAAACRA